MVIAMSRVLTIIAWALGFDHQADSLAILCTPKCIDVVTCIINLFWAIDGGQSWLNHHGRPLFHLSKQEKTTITSPSNLVHDDDVDG